MKATVLREVEIDVRYVLVNVAVRYDEEDMPNDFPLRDGNMWKAIIDIDNKSVVDWPIGKSGAFHMKITDQGSYDLLDSDMNVIESIHNDYVPNSLLPGDYGDYLELAISDEGKILNFLENPSFDDFFKKEED